MQVPFRLATVGRGTVDIGLMAAIAISTAVFTSTPLILKGVIDTFDLETSAAGFLSGCQLAGFVLTSFLAGRVARPSRATFVLAIVLLSAANACSAIVDDFGWLLVCRFLAGLALGALTWLAWSAVFGDEQRMGSVAVIGPLAGVLVSPLVGVAVEVSSFRSVYLGLGIVGLLPLLRIPEFSSVPREKKIRHRGGVPVAFILISSLTLVSFGGSAVFVFSGVIAEVDHGISPALFSLVLSLNAAAGIPSSSWTGARPLAGLWLAGCGISAVLFTTMGSALIGAAAIIFWGFAYWMGVPGAFGLISRVSRYPSERAGDAQAAMAVGRIFGPVVGGSLMALGSQAMLGLVAGGLMILGGVVIAAVDAVPAYAPSTRSV